MRSCVAMFNLAGKALMTAALALPAAAQAQDTVDMGAARQAAEAWLSYADAGHYGKTWDDAAVAFQGAIAKPKWEQTIKSVLAPLGRQSSRVFQSSSYSTSLPGAPAGEYVVLQYRTDFANKTGAIETVTPMRQADGKWRVSGYFIR